MINQQLLDFIKKQTEQGTSKEVITKELLGSGWVAQDIEEGFNTLNQNSSGAPTAPYNPNFNTNSNIAQQLRPKKHLVLKFTIGFFLIASIVWAGFEVVNYKEYLYQKSIYKCVRDPFLGMPCFSPKYQMLVVQGFYKIFPSLNPVPPGMAYKPVIYFYPTKTEQVKVQLEYKGELIADYPAYNYEEKGWTVTAYPDGKIINSDGKEYSYLFWEGKSFNKVDYDLSTGFVVKGEDTVEFLQNTLSKMGLTPKEYNEFIVYWYPKMKDNKYNLIHFAGAEYTDTAPLTIIPKPDSMLRVFMVFKPLDKNIEIKPQEIKTFTRTGFSVIEWGGEELGE